VTLCCIRRRTVPPFHPDNATVLERYYLGKVRVSATPTDLSAVHTSQLTSPRHQKAAKGNSGYKTIYIMFYAMAEYADCLSYKCQRRGKMIDMKSMEKSGHVLAHDTFLFISTIPSVSKEMLKE
jgi:hypothetical protein